MQTESQGRVKKGGGGMPRLKSTSDLQMPLIVKGMGVNYIP